jgi:chromosomal replication initiator protein
MKKDIFIQYADKVCELFSITRQQLFSKKKKRDYVDARHLLYYLCHKRPMRISYIQSYMKEYGYAIDHPSVIHGIKVAEDKMNTDNDYVMTVKDIERSVF